MSTLPRNHGAPTIRHHAAVVCAFLLSLVAAAPVAAQQDRCQAPPGRSGIEQYCESLPGPGGPQAGTGDSERRRVDRRTERRLRSAGDEGAALLGLVGASPGGGSGDGTAGDGGSPSDEGGGGTATSGKTADSEAASGSPGEAEDEPAGGILSALSSSVEEGPTVTDALAWILIAIAIAAFALAWVSWRRRQPDDPASGDPAP